MMLPNKRRNSFVGDMYLAWAEGNTVPLSGLPTKLPSEVSGLTMWVDYSDISSLYVDAGTTNVTAEDDLIYRAADKSGNSNHWDQSDAGIRGAYKLAIQNGKSAGYYDDSEGFVGPPTNADLYAAGAKTIFIVARVNTGWVNNDHLLGDASGYFQCKIVTGNLLKTSNYDGATDTTTGQAFVDNTAFLYTSQHGSGALRDSINGGAFAADVASGNTTSLATAVGLFARATNYTPGYIFEVATYNVEVPLADVTLLNNYFIQKWGL